MRFLFFKRGGLTCFIPDGAVLKSFVPSRLDALKLAFKDGYVAISQMMVSDGEESLLGQARANVELQTQICLSSAIGSVELRLDVSGIFPYPYCLNPTIQSALSFALPYTYIVF